MYVIFDLDGTLADCEHRRHFIDDNDWDGFYEACDKDEPIWPIVMLFWLLKDEGTHRIEIWSGRSDQVREKTVAWLMKYNLLDVINNDIKLLMRPAGDYQDDVALKIGWLQTEYLTPDLIFDDRDKVVKMWREQGIRCLQVANGDF